MHEHEENPILFVQSHEHGAHHQVARQIKREFCLHFEQTLRFGFAFGHRQMPQIDRLHRHGGGASMVCVGSWPTKRVRKASCRATTVSIACCSAAGFSGPRNREAIGILYNGLPGSNWLKNQSRCCSSDKGAGPSPCRRGMEFSAALPAWRRHCAAISRATPAWPWKARRVGQLPDCGIVRGRSHSRITPRDSRHALFHNLALWCALRPGVAMGCETQKLG